MTVIPIALLQPQAIEGLQTRVLKSVVTPLFDNTVINLNRMLSGYVKLPTELTHISDPDRPNTGIPQINFPSVQIRKGFIAKVRCGQRSKKCSGLRAMQV